MHAYTKMEKEIWSSIRATTVEARYLICRKFSKGTCKSSSGMILYYKALLTAAQACPCLSRIAGGSECSRNGASPQWFYRCSTQGSDREGGLTGGAGNETAGQTMEGSMSWASSCYVDCGGSHNERINAQKILFTISKMYLVDQQFQTSYNWRFCL